MDIMKNYKLFVLGLPKTLRFNFHYFPFKTAIKLPVLLTHRVRLKKMKGKVIIDSQKINRGMILYGFAHVSINDINEYSLWNVEGMVVFKAMANFGAGTKIAVGQNATLTSGGNFYITARSEIACFNNITFGDNNLLSWDILVMDTDAHPIYNEKGIRINDDKPIKIGNHVWIGCRTTVLKGAKIGDGCVIGSGSLINKNFNNKNSILAGKPIKIIKENISWGNNIKLKIKEK